MTWEPSTEARIIGEELQGAYPYVRGSLTSESDPVVQRPPGAGTRALAAYLRSRWSLSSAGMVRAASMSSAARRADGTWRRRDLHEDGRAIDAMIGRDLAKGREIADWCIVNAAQIGLQYLVFDGTDWCVSTVGPAFEPVATSQDRRAWGRSVDMHRDHVHLELTPAAAADPQLLERLGGPPASRPPPRSAPRPPPSALPPTEPAALAVEPAGGMVALAGLGALGALGLLAAFQARR